MECHRLLRTTRANNLRQKGQNILATIKVGNFQKGHKEYTNAVHAGWAVSKQNPLYDVVIQCNLEVFMEY